MRYQHNFKFLKFKIKKNKVNANFLGCLSIYLPTNLPIYPFIQLSIYAHIILLAMGFCEMHEYVCP